MRGSTKLRAWRDKKGLSQVAAAAMVGTQQGVWCAWEKGTRRPPLRFIVKLEKLADIKPSEWLGTLNEPKRRKPAESDAAAE